MGPGMADPVPDSVLRTRLDALYPLAMTISLMDFLGCSLLAWLFWLPSSAVMLSGWLGICFCVVLARVIVSRTILARGRLSPRGSARVVCFFAAFAGCVWALGLIWMLATGDDHQVMFVVCVELSAVTMRIVNVVYWPTYLMFVLPQGLGAAIGIGLSGRPEGMILAVAAVGLMVALLGASKRLARAVLRAHRLAETNQALINSLAERSRELEEACRTLEQVSRTDPLTGLANRRSRDVRLSAEWDRAVRLGSTLGVIAIDVDHFKRYNDAHGHSAGDRCLCSVATLLQQSTRGALDLACRHGGEEFMLILPDIQLDALASTAERVRARVAIGTSDPALDLPERVTVSLGAAVCEPAAGGSICDLVLAADNALYRAKLAGRNRYEIAPIPQSLNDAAA